MSFINLQKIEKSWNDRISDSRKKLQKMGINKEPLRIMVNIMNSYKQDSLNILAKLENEYADDLITGNLARRILTKIDEHVKKKKNSLNSEDFITFEKQSREELKKQFKSAKKKRLSKYKK